MALITQPSKGKQRYYPKCRIPFDAVILCQHGDDGTDFFKRKEEAIQSLSNHDPALLQAYLAIEQDVGSSELAHAIANSLVGMSSERFSVVVLDVPLPRAFIDANRVREHALRPVFDYAGREDIAASFLRQYDHETSSIASTLRQLSSQGVVLDIHSMAPYSPQVNQVDGAHAVELSPTTLDRYVRAYTDPAMRGERCNIDIVTSLEDGSIIADHVLAAECARQFDQSGIHYRFNHPYHTNEKVMTTRYMHRHHTLAVDVPKDYIARTPGSQAFDLANLEPVPDMINAVAVPIAQAAKARLEQLAREA